jgi:hypothetical protein
MMKFKKWSLSASLLVTFFAITSNAFTQTLKVTTVNYTYYNWKVKECINGKHCGRFKLVDLPVVIYFPEPKSGTATLSAHFTQIYIPPYHAFCSQQYNVSQYKTATVTVNTLNQPPWYDCTISMQ